MSLLSVGGRFGDFVVEKLLGQGGMGDVYLVLLPASGENYVAEIMAPPENAGDDGWREIFDRESEFVHQLAERGVADIHDIGQDPITGYCYIVMTYRPGGNLPELLGMKAPSPEPKDIPVRAAPVPPPELPAEPAEADTPASTSKLPAVIGVLVAVLAIAGVLTAVLVSGGKAKAPVPPPAPEPVPAVEPAPAPEPVKILVRNDKTVRNEKIGELVWYYTIEDGMAVLWRGSDDGIGAACVDPMPQGKVEVPAKIGDYQVGALGSLAFFGCKNITEVVLPPTVKRLGNRCFLGCENLEKLDIPEAVERIGIWAFNRCGKLKRMDIKKCRKLDFDGGVFAYCYAIEDFAADPENPSFKVEDGILYSRDGKTLIAVPPVRTEYKFPKQLEAIGPYAFCGSRTSRLIVPASVKKFGEGVFLDCGNLELLAIAGDAPKLEGDWSWLFRGASGKLEIVVKHGSKGWKAIADEALPEKWPGPRGRLIRHQKTNQDGKHAEKSGKKKKRW